MNSKHTELILQVKNNLDSDLVKELKQIIRTYNKDVRERKKKSANKLHVQKDLTIVFD
jgi:hypothetical protein